jgi:hypothetical protein
MYLESGQKQTDREVDSIFNIFPALDVKKRYARFTSATHEDFSGLLSLNGVTSFDRLALDYFDQYVKGKDDSLEVRLAGMFKGHRADSTYPYPVRQANSKGFVIRGRVLDRNNKAVLAYVNVGVPDENIGTVTNHDGSFSLRIDETLEKDSLRVSMVGYYSKAFSINLLRKQKGAVTILLDQKVAELREVVVTSKSLRTKTEGNTTTSRFVSIGFPLRFFGAELGIKINLGKKPVKLKSFHFTIASSRIDTAVFRLNIYRFKGGMPYLNMLPQNILVPVGKRTGIYTVNLSGYDLMFKGDILISLELIETPSSARGTGAVFFSAGFLNSATWHRQTSPGRWKNARGLGIGFNVVVNKSD